MKVNLVFSEKIKNKIAIETSVKNVNAIQNYFHLIVLPPVDCCNDCSINAEKCAGCINNSIKTICITDKPLVDNWFSHEYRDYSVISIYDWERLYAPPSLKAYLTYQIAQSLIHFSADISEELALKIVHYEPIGCMYDMCGKKTDIKYGMVSGSLCPQCKGQLLQYGISEESIDAIERLLEHVRFEAIGKPRAIEHNRAFIVMRFSKDDENDRAYNYGIKEALKELGIDCIRADTELRSSQLLVKIQKNIEKARFIIAKVDVDNLNVYFELGYAMGRNKDVILISENSLILNLPSDLKNWECLTYEKEDYSDLKNKLLNYLKQNYFYGQVEE